MRGKIILAGLILGMSAVVVSAQGNVTTPRESDLYCSGTVTSESIPHDTSIITGEESNHRIIFEDGDYIYINKGSDQGVKPGDEFTIIRPVVDSVEIQWTKWQMANLHKMGTMWEDEGRIKVTVARPKVSIAQIEHGCGYMQRGDVALPFVPRPAPPLKPEQTFDRFAPANGKALAMVITGKKYQVQAGMNDVIYVNLGSEQGVKVGDYFRIFRYHGTQTETAYQTSDYAFDVDGRAGPTYGFGHGPAGYDWSNVPREDLGEGIVLRTGPNSATVLITFSLTEMFAGDYVELE